VFSSLLLVRGAPTSRPLSRYSQIRAAFSWHTPLLALEVVPKATFHKQKLELSFYERYLASAAMYRALNRIEQIARVERERYTFCITMRCRMGSRVIFCKDRVVSGEQRWQAIGAAEEAVLPVVHVYRMENGNGEEETIRIVSAREANKRERRIYIQQAAE